MDEEDLADMREARKLENTDAFRSEPPSLPTGAGTGAGGASGLAANDSLLASIVQPTTGSSIGERLLGKMGWRPGQGIGPRVSARQRRRQEVKQATRLGVKLPEEEDDALDGASADVKFAPRDEHLAVYEPKVGRSGLGYRPDGGGTSSTIGRTKGSAAAGPTISVGFGLGIDDADEDDVDVYAGGPSASGTRSSLLVDQDDDEDAPIRIGGTAEIKRRPFGTSSALNRSSLHWNDGRPVLAGFELDPNPPVLDKWYDFPPIPEGWRPRPARVWKAVTGGKWDKVEMPGRNPVPESAMRPQLSADQRGEILGEQQLKSRSVFEYLSEKSKERLAQVVDQVPTGVSLSAPHEPSPDIIVPPLSPRTASAALAGFIPFGDDLAKQDRYKSYLKSQTYNTREPNPRLLAGTPAEINKELADFAKSATMFKPMSFAMANRFTSSSANAADIAQPKPGLHVPDPEQASVWRDKSKIEPEPAEILTPRQEAARAGMYGNLTRRVESWAPNKLLCKRFGVPDPYPDGLGDKESATAAGGSPAKPLLSDVAWESKFVHREQPAQAEEEAAPAKSSDGPRTIADVGLADDDNQGRDTLTYKKPEIDIFKAIFASDDESDDDEEEDLKPPVQVAAQAKVERASAPTETDGHPVFRPPPTKDDNTKRTSEKEKKRKKKQSRALMSFDLPEDEEEEQVLLPKKKRKVPAQTAVNDDDDDEWVEKPVQPVGVARARASDFM